VLDGTDLSGLPEDRLLDPAKPHWFVDVQQTGYYLPAGQKVTLARRHQKNPDYANAKQTEGDFLTAWIDHGKAPTAGSYEYMLLVRATPAAMQKLSADPPYRVLQRDQAAHVVWDSADRRWACAFFAPQQVMPHAVASESLQVKAVDGPCLLMQEPVREGHLTLSIADPDLNLDHGVNQPRPLRLMLRGLWRLSHATATVSAWPLPGAMKDVRIVSTDAGATVVEILCRDGASYNLTLAQG